MLDALERWLRLSAERIHDQADALTALDRAIGDGDHGTQPGPRVRGHHRAARRRAPRRRDGDRARAGAVLRTAGRTLISTVGGAAGPLYGTAFMRAGGAIVAAEDDRVARPGPADGARGGHRRDRRARQGDAPARRRCSMRSSRRTRRGWPLSMAGATSTRSSRAVADAAEAGAAATIPLLATKGRASYLGERSIGHQDPGATSSALLLRALADTVTAG